MYRKLNNNCPIYFTLPTVAPPKTIPTGIADTGATAHYLDNKAAPYCSNIVQTTTGPRVKVANGTIITPQQRAQLKLAPTLSTSARTGHIFKDIKSGSLISIGQLCDDDCVAIFNKYNLKIYKHGKIIIQGLRNTTNGLWHIPLAPKSDAPWMTNPHDMPEIHNKTHQAHSAINNIRIKRDLASYLHACAGSPTTWALIRAIRRNHFITWPGLTESLINKHLEKSTHTSKGHLRMQQKNIQSTRNKPMTLTIPLNESLDLQPSQEPTNPSTHNIFITIATTDKLKQTSYSDQTGKFPAISSRGNQYIMVLYDYDTNAILCEPLKTRRAAEITQGWKKMHKILQDNGHAPKLHILDNECSDELRQAFIKNNIDFQRVPPHSHRRNAAERAIQTFKNHFIAILASCDPDFPLTEWDRLLPQAQLTLNLLRSSRRQPSLSAQASIFGQFDFNRTPLAPPGTRVIVHETPEQRSSFGPHGVDGWYIGPSSEHYRCYKCYIPQTRSIRDALTVDWFPKTVPIPKVSNEEYLRQTAEDMLSLLQTQQATTNKNNIPSLTYGSNITNAFIQIAQILKRASPRPTPSQEPTSTTPDLPQATDRPQITTTPVPRAPNNHNTVQLPRVPITHTIPVPRVPSPILHTAPPTRVPSPMMHTAPLPRVQITPKAQPPTHVQQKQPAYQGYRPTPRLSPQCTH